MSTITNAVEKKRHEELHKADTGTAAYEYPLPKERNHNIRNLMLVLLVCFIFIGGGITGLFMFNKRNAGKVLESTVIPPAESSLAAVEPEVPPAETVQKRQFPKLRLEGVFDDPFDPQAIINGRILRTGDTIAGAKIVEIADGTVTVEYDGKKMELRGL